MTLSSIITKYTPKTLAEYSTFNLKVMTIINGYPRGTLTRPLLLVGPPGCGKTLLANLLAAEIIPDMTQHDIRSIDVSQETSIKTVKSISETIGLYANNSKNLRVCILDEVDCFTPPAMNALKGLMTQYPSLDRGVFFILTTNHASAVSDAVRDRCQMVHFPATTVSDVLPMAERVLTGEGIPYSVDDLKAALTKDASGLASFRDMWGVIEEVMTRRAMQQA